MSTRNPISRRMLRTLTFQTLFQLSLNKDESETAALQHAMYSHEQFEEEVLVDKQELLERYPELSYAYTVVEGVMLHQEELDQLIATHAVGWTIDRIVRMDLIILRIAMFEMLYLSDEIPARVALNEALELAKRFSEDKSRKFINGILSNLVKD